METISGEVTTYILIKNKLNGAELDQKQMKRIGSFSVAC